MKHRISGRGRLELATYVMAYLTGRLITNSHQPSGRNDGTLHAAKCSNASERQHQLGAISLRLRVFFFSSSEMAMFCHGCVLG
jgi:hypothetical protein